MALSEIGHDKIASLSDDNKAARQCDLHYADCRDELLEQIQPRFAIKNVFLENKEYASSGNLTFADADPDTIDDSASAFITTGGIIAGMRITPYVDSGTITNDGTYTVATVSDSQIVLISTDELTAEGPTGSIKLILRHSFAYDYAFDKPSDYLMDVPLQKSASNINPPANYVVEGDYIYANDDEIQLSYVAQITDVTKFSQYFIRALALLIASKIAIPVANSRGVKEDVTLLYERALLTAKKFDSTVGQQDKGVSDDAYGWLAGR